MRILPFMKPKKGVTLAGVDYNPDSGGGGAVSSVNGQTGAVVLDAEDVGALPDDTPFVDSDIIAPTEATSTASQAYTVGDYFINSDGDLCRCTVDIASGGTITVDTNCVVVTVGNELNTNIILKKVWSYYGNAWTQIAPMSINKHNIIVASYVADGASTGIYWLTPTARARDVKFIGGNDFKSNNTLTFSGLGLDEDTVTISTTNNYFRVDIYTLG